MGRRCLMSLIVVILIVGAASLFLYSGLVSDQELIIARKTGIESMYQQRYEMTTQLVATVKDAADYETGTLQAVVDAQAKLEQVQLPLELASDPNVLAAYKAAQDGLSSAVERFFTESEHYPQLRATESLLALQDQMEGSENRIAAAWGDFIEAVRIYNGRRRRVPWRYMAKLFEFEGATTLSTNPQVREMSVSSRDGGS